MNRRTFISGLTLTGAGAIGILGSSAFSSIQANRSLVVELEDDHSAFLVLDVINPGGRAWIDGGKLRFKFPGIRESEYPTNRKTNPEGVGSESIYRFDSDAGGDSSGLFAIVNQGTQKVKVFGTQKKQDKVPSVRIFDVETGGVLTDENPHPIDVGEKILAGLEIDTHNVDTQSYSDQITIHARSIDE